MKHEYIVTTDKGICKLSSPAPIDLISAQKIFNDMDRQVNVIHIKELNFFEKVVDKIRKR